MIFPQEDAAHVYDWGGALTSRGQCDGGRASAGVCHQPFWPLCSSKLSYALPVHRLHSINKSRCNVSEGLSACAST